MPVSDDVRRAHLRRAIHALLEWPRFRVETQGAFDAIVVGPGPNHILHAVLAVLSVGLWLVVWAWVALTHRQERISVAVDDEGRVSLYSTTRRQYLTWNERGTLGYV